jgi:YegS/Rv2252/BmrU family lipid kinase
MKKLLLIINPASGTKQGKKYLSEMVSCFYEYGYITTVMVTQKRGDGTEFAENFAGEFDLIVCSGGDGTFNEVVAGLIKSGSKIPMGYIPSGSTNDFAASLHITGGILKSAKDIMKGRPRQLDIGSFNGRHFSYVASFGAFTKASYSTPQNIKNALGHLAYILEGMKDIPQIKPEHVKIDLGDRVLENDYLFGAISNSTSLGGVLTLDRSIVDMNDAMFEMMFIKSPANINELNEIIHAITWKEYDKCSMIDFARAGSARLYTSSTMDWSLDGEFEPGSAEIEILNLHSAISLIVNEK